jgi:hypothetical protein
MGEEVMPEIVRILTDDIGNITHLIDEEDARLSVAELAELIDEGKDYYVTFGEERRYSITMIAEEGHLEPTVDDPEGKYSMRDLPTEEDPEENEIEEMFDEMNRMGEFEEEGFQNTEQSEDKL